MNHTPLQAEQLAFMVEYKLHQREHEKFAIHLTKNRDEAKDLAQESLTRMWQSREKIEQQASFKQYLFSVTINVFRNSYRRKKFWGLLPDDVIDTLQSHYPLPDREADVHVVHTALQKLTPTAREAILLFECSDLSIASIARIQGSSESAVKVRLMRARFQLQKSLGISLSKEKLP
jgi:RNA polymerase sigma-70 factor, ECF subfamily